MTHAAESIQEVPLKLTTVEIHLTPDVEMVRSETEDTATVSLLKKSK